MNTESSEPAFEEKYPAKICIRLAISELEHALQKLNEVPGPNLLATIARIRIDSAVYYLQRAEVKS